MGQTRNNGSSTRVIDRCIQELFNTGKTFVYESRDNAEINRELSVRFERRLATEHPNARYQKVFKDHDGIICHKYTLNKES